MNERESFENAVADAQIEHDQRAAAYQKNPNAVTAFLMRNAEYKALDVLGRLPF